MTRTDVRTRKGAQAPDQRLTIAQAAARLGVSHWTIRNRIANGSLTAQRVGPRLIRVLASDVDALGVVIPTGGHGGIRRIDGRR